MVNWLIINKLKEMTEEIIIAGFGGQGVLSMGKILAYSAIMQNQEVSWFPSYGPEMRGGTANVTVILSDERISSPILHFYDTAILLNQQSLDKFENSVKPGGVLLFDSNGLTRLPERTDIQIFRVDAADASAKMESTKAFNMVVLGGYLKIKPIVKIENVYKGLEKSIPARYSHLLELNKKAIAVGQEIVEKVRG
jgi:2-oxoglutarate ferredoxin oxidoreductase subunit gamma